MCKKLETSMEMVKVDFGDATCVVANFVPTEYSLIGRLSTSDELNVSSLTAGNNENDLRDAGSVEGSRHAERLEGDLFKTCKVKPPQKAPSVKIRF